MKKASVFLLTFCLFVAGCATPVYKNVFKEGDSFNTRTFDATTSDIYKVTSHVLMAKNFMIEKEDMENGFILGKRSFQRGKRTIVLVVQTKVSPVSEKRTMLYLNAIQTTEISYVADRTRFFLFIIPLPGGGGKQATQIKEGETVIEDKNFYQDFFTLVEKGLKADVSAQERTEEKKI